MKTQGPARLVAGARAWCPIDLVWSVGIAVVAYLWAVRLYDRRREAGPT